MRNKKVFITQPFMPPLEEFIPFLENIWASKVLTNNGPFHHQLEDALCKYLKVNHIALVSNGTLGLLLALKSLDIQGDVITTPYSFVATSNALLWNNNNPIFVDIDPLTLNIDPLKIEGAITPKTTAILALHSYGTPCDVVHIRKIADKYRLKIIYDACHSFGIEDESGSVLSHGDLSVLSFHATKVFSTIEGGAIVCPDVKIKEKIDNLKNFGIVNETTVSTPGLNAKLNEVSAAFGLLQLNHIENAIERRKSIWNFYRNALKDVKGLELLMAPDTVKKNYSYFPIFVLEDYPLSRDALYEQLKREGIYTRRYFYPLISDFSIFKKMSPAAKENLVVASARAKQVLCLPIYPDLSLKDVDFICSLLRKI